MSKLTPVTYTPVTVRTTVKEPEVYINEYNLCKELHELNKKYVKQWFRTSNEINVKKIMNIDLLLSGVLHGIHTNKLVIAYTTLKTYNDSSNPTKNLPYYLTIYNNEDRNIFIQKFNELINGLIAVNAANK